MLKEHFSKWKEVFQNKEGNNKKKIENLVVFLVLLVIVIIAINVIWKDDKSQRENQEDIKGYKQLASEQTLDGQGNNVQEQEYNLESNLKNILSKIAGAGKIEVLVTYSETSTVIPMYNENTKESTTKETDKSGGNRDISQKDTSKEIIYTEENGEKKPITQSVVMPKIEGAIIISEGATNTQVKTNIIQAVEAATGIATHKIQVFPMNT